jgi:YidC/Oxa1 family membrane protein insertase
MIAQSPWQAVLSGLGWVLAQLFDVTHNYGLAIIVLTVGIRLLLLPLGVKQIKSMQATQLMQPKIKAIQTKYKGDRQRQNEEMMKLYKEHGYNPLSGCLPVLLQLPVLITLFAVLRMPSGLAHLPADSNLHAAVVSQTSSVNFLSTNLLCSASQAGSDYTVRVSKGTPNPIPVLHCGKIPASRIPYYVLALLMIGTTYFQQRQMTRASPAGASNSQQQAIMRIMPLMFGVWGYFFPAGLIVYWTTTNAIQIGQQWFLLHRKGAPLAPAKHADGQMAGPKGKESDQGGQRGKGSDRRSSSERGRTSPLRGSATPVPKRPAGGVVPRRPSGGGSGGNGRGSSSRGQGSNGGRSNQRRQQSSGGGGDAGSRKKRPKR